MLNHFVSALSRREDRQLGRPGDVKGRSANQSRSSLVGVFDFGAGSHVHWGSHLVLVYPPIPSCSDDQRDPEQWADKRPHNARPRLRLVDDVPIRLSRDTDRVPSTRHAPRDYRLDMPGGTSLGNRVGDQPDAALELAPTSVRLPARPSRSPEAAPGRVWLPPTSTPAALRILGRRRWLV